MITKILQFIQNHWWLCAITGVILVLIIAEELINKLRGIPKLSPQETVLGLNRGNIIVIDLRSKTAFASGHILGAINVVPNEVEQNLKTIAAHKEQNIVLVSDRDTEVSAMNSKLKAAGCTKVYTLAGSLNAWKDARLPLSKI